ncbi:MAG TPA: GAF domain-containing sensor histidine kinase [Hyphomonadaceae bacterium]|nr:GAF domain-containing sensor histidine kinase [Hyphomonadaceae bacterium]
MEDFSKDVEAVSRIDAVPQILDVVCRMTGMGFAAVARVTEDRWIACSVRDDIQFGLKRGGELAVKTTICDEIRGSFEAVVIDEVAASEHWRTHHTPLQYGFQSYISFPIMLRGDRFFGTLCAIDPRPNKLDTPEIRGMFKLFADLIAFHLEATDLLAVSEASLKEERATSAQRDQFIAVLGHDLRTPLGAINAGAQLLARESLSRHQMDVVELMRASVKRMSGLIGDVLDLARGRFGEGITVYRRPTADILGVIGQAVNELQSLSPGRRIDVRFDLEEPVSADPQRIGQLFSNLLSNAIGHGAPDKPIRVYAFARGGSFQLSVSNAGRPIPPETMGKLFQPFVRGVGASGQQGLGLGLYIASEIARAHSGKLEAVSNPDETKFTLSMPSGT